MCDRSGKTALHHARNAACTATLLRSAPDLERRDWYGRTALHTAIRRQGDLERFRLLLNAGADVNVVDNWNRTPISYLSQFDRIGVARLLYERCGVAVDINIADVEGFTPLMTAIESNSHQMVDFLISIIDREALTKRNTKEATVLHLIMRCADEETLTQFVNHDFRRFQPGDLDCTDARGFISEAAISHRWRQQNSASLLAALIVGRTHC